VVQAAAVLEDTVLEDTKSEDTPALEADTQVPLDTLPTAAEVEPSTPPPPQRMTTAELSTLTEELCATARRLPTRTQRTVETAAREALTTDPIPNVDLKVTQAKTITLTLCTGPSPDPECASCTVPPSAVSTRPTSAGSKPQPPQPSADSPRPEPDPPQAARPKTNPQPTRPTTTKPPEFERLEE
ncbi:MAG TPA: hypothetical protein PK095_03470, partial [Myxococcota bacterium]|nr:hypothetical protein [Myxococcota bacterium]